MNGYDQDGDFIEEIHELEILACLVQLNFLKWTGNVDWFRAL